MADRARGTPQQQPDVTNIRNQLKALETMLQRPNDGKRILSEIDAWKLESIKKVEKKAETMKKVYEKLLRDNSAEMNRIFRDLKPEIQKRSSTATDKDVRIWNQSINDIQRLKAEIDNIQLIEDEPLSLPIKRLASRDEPQPQPSARSSTQDSKERLNKSLVRQISSPNPLGPHVDDGSAFNYPSIIFSSGQNSDVNINELLKHLLKLPPMDKHGPLSGKCEVQTRQMEKFLQSAFGFTNVPGDIVQGVKNFAVNKPPKLQSKSAIIYFPSLDERLFEMSISEILQWQKSYRVYSSQRKAGISPTFLSSALRGLSESGSEAFLMKFVIRISSCPILMEFDGKVIPRRLEDDWINNIKLVSVSGIDFAGRIHDIDDIRTYIKNWRDIYEMDRSKDVPRMKTRRDFQLRREFVMPVVNETLLLNDLEEMAFLRLVACENEGVQVVVETGIGLGVFAGREIGMEPIVQTTSAMAFRNVLTKYAPKFKNIKAVVFALPVFRSRNGVKVRSCYDAFVHEFSEPKYQGSIPVMIADQDMHRLTVAIARRGFLVSELNPADSHGVFGEYWQNLGPAVEEKLALTTVGLLVQHHLFNEEVLNPDNYKFI